MVDSTMKIISHSLEGFENIKISFGKNRYSSFYTTDVPPIAIRDLRLYNNEGELIHYWKMQQHNRDDVFDLIGGKRAVVEKGIEIQCFHFTCPSISQTPFSTTALLPPIKSKTSSLLCCCIF